MTYSAGPTYRVVHMLDPLDLQLCLDSTHHKLNSELNSIHPFEDCFLSVVLELPVEWT